MIIIKIIAQNRKLHSQSYLERGALRQVYLSLRVWLHTSRPTSSTPGATHAMYKYCLHLHESCSRGRSAGSSS